MMQRPLGSSTAFSIDSLIGSPPQPSPGHFVYTAHLHAHGYAAWWLLRISPAPGGGGRPQVRSAASAGQRQLR
ncbi:Homeobox protein GBX-2 [Myotis brandtii]|uniref:Homeobox protein GBX-2 n=1 Tax=Myotis brandtii TaxID=109478 RepID=S7N281_MYOBR|nr:Homeobox protein GBX-2 [Myotis brandtii]